MGAEELMFIGRRLDNSIYGCWTSRQKDDADHPRQEEMPDDHPELLAFINRPLSKPATSLDDLIGALKLKGVIVDADLVSTK